MVLTRIVTTKIMPTTSRALPASFIHKVGGKKSPSANALKLIMPRSSFSSYASFPTNTTITTTTIPIHNTTPSFSTYASSYLEDEDDNDYDEYCNYLLPEERSKMNIPGQGWDVDTVVKESLIPGAGSGRFAQVAVPQVLTRVFKKPIVHMSSITTLASIPRDVCIVFENANDISSFVDLYKNEAGRDHREIVEYLSHYVISLSSMPGCCAVASSSFVANHGDPGVAENVKITRDGDDLVAYSVMPIKKGDEILNDYRDFDYFPQFFLDFCREEGVVDVVTNLNDVLK